MPKGIYQREPSLPPSEEKLKRERVRQRKASKKHYHAHPEKILNAHLYRKYGLTLEQVNHMKIAQNNKCAICSAEFSKSTIRTMKAPTDGAKPVVDHCHKTNKNREILCSKCNMAIGLFNDDPYIINLASAYLNKWKSP